MAITIRPARPVPPLLEHIRSLRGSNGQRMSRSLMVSSALFLALFAAILVLLPLRVPDIVRVTMPERERTIILPEIPPEPPAEAISRPSDLLPPLTMQHLEPRPDSEFPAPRRREEPKLDPNLGKEGRKRATEATAELARATSAIDRALGDLSSSLRQSGAPETARGPRMRRVRSGRGEGELAAYDAGTASSGASNDLGGSQVQSSLVTVGSLASPRAEDAAASGATGDAGAPGVYRTNASLLAVIQRYAAGIQYCYSAELKRDPSLKGKLVVAITVAANGRVTGATVVQNSVGSERLASCAMTQILNWKFPPIAEGVTTFQTPFVFTPPN